MDKFAAMENVLSNPNGIIVQLTQELKNVNLKLERLQSMIHPIGKRKKLELKAPLEQRLSLITDDKVNQILANSLNLGLLRILNEGYAVDKDVLFSESKKLGISKHDIKIKLELLNRIIYKQVRINGKNMWCIVVNK